MRPASCTETVQAIQQFKCSMIISLGLKQKFKAREQFGLNLTLLQLVGRKELRPISIKTSTTRKRILKNPQTSITLFGKWFRRWVDQVKEFCASVSVVVDGYWNLPDDADPANLILLTN